MPFKVKKDTKDYKLDPLSKKDMQDDDDGLLFIEPINLTDTQKEKMYKDIKAEWDAIDEERKDMNLDCILDNLEKQFYGMLDGYMSDVDTEFHLSRNTTSNHIMAILNTIVSSVFGASPIFSTSPREETALNLNGVNLSRKIEEYIDYALDVKGGNDIKLKEPTIKACFNALVKKVGILKVKYEPKETTIRYREVYKGGDLKPIPQDQEFATTLPKEVIVESKLGMLYNEGMYKFLTAHPIEPEDKDEKKKYYSNIKKLAQGKTIRLTVSETSINNNHPSFESVDPINFYVRKSTDGYSGLRSSKLISEKRDYTYRDLKKLEADKKIDRADDLKYEADGSTEVTDYMTKSFEIWEDTFCWQENEDSDEVKIKVWRYDKLEMILGAIKYPFYGFDCEYIPLYTALYKDGFYQDSVAEKLTDSSTYQDILLNRSAEDVNNAVVNSPIIEEGGNLAKQWIDGDLKNGKPWILKDRSEFLDFVNNHRTPLDIRSILALLETIERDDAKRTGVNETRTGGESTLDPNSPARKMELMQRMVNTNIGYYIQNFVTNFAIVPNLIIKLYDQISDEPRKYRIRAKEVVEGDSPFKFGLITREEMRAAVNFYSEATNFYKDEADRLNRSLTMSQFLLSLPEIATNSDARNEIITEVIRASGNNFENRINKILPTMEERRMKEAQGVAAGLEYYRQLKSKELEEGIKDGTATTLELDPMKVYEAGVQGLKEANSPPPEQVLKQREKAIS